MAPSLAGDLLSPCLLRVSVLGTLCCAECWQVCFAEMCQPLWAVLRCAVLGWAGLGWAVLALLHQFALGCAALHHAVPCCGLTPA